MLNFLETPKLNGDCAFLRSQGLFLVVVLAVFVDSLRVPQHLTCAPIKHSYLKLAIQPDS
jgi:hypothetical protein